MAAIRTWLAFAALCAAVSACERDQGTEQTAPTNASTPPLAPKLPAADAPLDREALLLAVARAASSFTSGGDQVAAQRDLDGKPYELRLRFGCPGGARQLMPGGAFSVSFDAEDRVLRLRAVPNVTSEDAVAAALAGPASEAVEGFWIGRPWLLSTSCPANPQPQPAAPTGEEPVAAEKSEPATIAPAPTYAPRVGIAQFFTEQDVRTRRRDDRGYEITKALAENEQPSAQGYDLVLTGRLRRGADGRVIMCTGDPLAAPPPCLISATFDRVSVERADTGDMLAEWGGG